MPNTSQDVFPLLVADLADVESLDVIRTCAEKREVVAVPLLAAPVDRRRHILEVYAPNSDTPERFMAEPAGGPTAEGFPLRVEPFRDPALIPEGEASDPFDDEPTLIRKGAVVRPRVATSPHMSRGQTRDLEVAQPEMPSIEEATHLGRQLAGGKYQLDELIGIGGMGAVYRAHHRDLDKVVAVKTLHPSFQADATFARRFQSEALTMSRIDHPHVTRVLDFGQEEDGMLYLVMEYLEGLSLESIFEEEGPLPLDRLVRLMRQVCSALGHVHRHGIIHRDVKPSNIIVVAGHDEDEDVPTEIAKVCDFGIAHVHGGDGTVAGTVEYMAPEQCRGVAVDARSDVYACGVVLYELATGRTPFSGETADVMGLHLTTPPMAPSLLVPDIDPLFEQIVMKALSKEPAERQPSMRHLRAELRDLLAPVLLDAAPESSAEVSISPPAPAAAPKAEDAQRPVDPESENWLEGRNAGMNNFFTTLADTVDHLQAYHAGGQLADRLIADAEPWLAETAGIADDAKFSERAFALQQAVRQLMKEACAVPLGAIIKSMRRILREEAEHGMSMSERMKAAGRVLRTLRDPIALVPLVDQALAHPTEPAQELSWVFIEAQGTGAEALLQGRLERHATALARNRFAAFVSRIGPAAMPVLRDALAEALARGEREGAMVEDLLRALPQVTDEATGKVVIEFLRGGSPAVMAYALVGLSALWGERSRPILLGALGNPDDTVRMGAIMGLRALRAIDPIVVRHLGPIVSGTTPAGDDLRASAVAALVDAQAPARSEATTLLVRAFARTTAATGAFAVHLARALVAIGAPNAVDLIRDRAEAIPELRRQLGTIRPPA